MAMNKKILHNLDIPYIYNEVDDWLSFSKKHELGHQMTKSHFHEAYELYYLYQGERQFFIKDRTLKIQAKDLIMIRPNVLHRTDNGKKAEHEKFVLNFKKSSLSMFKNQSLDTLDPYFKKDYLLFHVAEHEQILLENFFSEMMEETKREEIGYETQVLTLLGQLLVFVARHIDKMKNLRPMHVNPMHERISNIVKYINDHYYEALSLDRLAERFYISPYYLSRAFKEVTQFGFSEYINSVRIKEATILLAETKLSIGQIAGKVGYRSSTHFGRIFKHYIGKTPLTYRKHQNLK